MAVVEWSDVAMARRSLADILDELDPSAWDHQSLCHGWRVRDVVGHLVWMAEGTLGSVLADVAREMRPVNSAMARIARRAGEAAPGELTERLRSSAGGTFALPGLGPTSAMGEVVVHGLDALVAVDVPAPLIAPEHAAAVVGQHSRLWLVFGAGRAVTKVRFVASDAGWDVGPVSGRRIEAPTTELLLMASGRRPLPLQPNS